MTREWTGAELEAIGPAEELQVSSYRPDGTLRPFITIWVVRAGADVIIRSAYGAGNGWYRRAVAAGSGRIRAGGVETDVVFELVDPTDPAHTAIDGVYHAKYDRHGPAIVGTVVDDTSHRATVRLRPT